MAIINKITGYTGYTVDTSGGLSDINGSTSKCLIAVILDHQSHDIDVEFSDNVDDWGISVGDNSIIPVFEPRVLYVNKNNCIVEFTLIQEYPSNSPCLLVYRSDTAEIRISESIESKPKVPNVIGGYFGFTIHNGQETLYHGLTNLMQISIKFPYQSNKVGIKISEGFDHWGISVGDGRKIIPVHSPNVLFVNKDNAVVQFELSEPYPSNSPCFLVYRTKEAYIQLLTDSETLKMVPVSDITNVNNFVFMNGYMNLSEAVVEPVNATNQYIEWTVLSGPGIVENNTSLKGTGIGNIHLKATIQESDTKTFTKNFVIKSDKDIVTIESNLPNEVNLLLLTPPEVFYLKARSKYNLPLIYQWYKNTDNGFVEIDQRTEKFTTPTTTAGTVEYKCEIKTQYSDTVSSNSITVRVEEMIENIRFENPIDSLQINESHKFKILPETVDKNRIIWSTNDNSISSIEGGLLRVFGLGRIVIKAVYNSLFGYSREVTKEINITPYIQVTDVTNLITTIETNRDITLTATILPSEVSNREIEWQIIEKGSTNARLTGNVLRALNSGNIRMRCIVKKGLSQLSHYIKEFQINVNQAFVPVTSLELELDSSIEMNRDYDIIYTVNPNNATNKVVECKFVDDSVVKGRIESISNGVKVRFNSHGEAKLKFTIVNGISNGNNFELEKVINVNKQFVPVQNIINFTTNIEDVELPQILTGEVLPSDATNKDMTFRIVSAPSEFNARIVEGNKIRIKSGLEWWRLNPTPREDLSDQWLKNFTDPILIEVTIINGLGMGRNYTKELSIGYSYPASPDIYTPVEDITFSLENTNLNRAHVPIVSKMFKITPIYATNKEVQLVAYIQNDPTHSKNILEFYQFEEDEEGGPPVYPLTINSEKYYKDLDNAAYFTMIENSVVTIEATVPNGLTRNTPFIKKFTNIQIRPPFIPANPNRNKIINLYFNEKNRIYSLDNFFTNINDDNAYMQLSEKYVHDFTKPTYDIVSIESLNISEGELSSEKYNNNYIRLNKKDLNKNITISCKVENGLQESVIFQPIKNNIDSEDLYFNIVANIVNDPNIEKYLENESDYDINISISDVITPRVEGDNTEKFMSFILTGLNETLHLEIRTSTQQVITKTGDEVRPFLEQHNLDHYLNKKDLYLMKLKLKNNKYVKVKYFNEISLLSTRGSENETIIIDGQTFTKADITEVEFWDENTILTVPDKLKLFGYNFINLTKISNIPNNITGDECLAHFMNNCIKFNQPITIPENAIKGNMALYGFMENCTNFNSTITFAGKKAIGKLCLGNFLKRCTSFNKSITLPTESIEGDFAMYRFMTYCNAYNSDIQFPKKVKGYRVMEHCLSFCNNFSRNFKLPQLDEKSTDQIASLLFNTRFRAIIAIDHEITVKDVGPLTLGTFRLDSTGNADHDIQLNGPGAISFDKLLFDNPNGEYPFRKVRVV